MKPVEQGQGKQVASGMGWLVSAAFITRALSALSMLVLTRILLPEDFGLVALATTLLQILSVVTEMQLTNALIQMAEVRRRHFDAAFTIGFVRAVLVAGVLIGGGHVLAALYDDPRLIPLTMVLSLDSIFAGLRSPKFALYDKTLRFSYSASLETVARVFAFAAAVGIALTTRSYWAIAASQIAGTAAITIGSYILSPYRPRFSLLAWRSILSFSIWLNFIGIVSTLSSRLDNFLVAGFLSKAILGQYVVGNQLAMLVSEVLLQPLQRALFPGFANANADRDRLRGMYVRAQALLIGIGLPVGIILSLIARPAVHLFIGPEWKVTALVIEFLAPIFGIQLIFGPVNAIAMAVGETRALFYRSLWMLVLRLPLIVGGLYYGGLVGILIARTLSGGVLLWIADATLVGKILGISVKAQLKTATRSLLSSAGLVAAGLTFRMSVPLPTGSFALAGYIVSLGFVGMAFYLAAHWVLWNAAGRPDGVERNAAQAFAMLAGKLRRARTGA